MTKERLLWADIVRIIAIYLVLVIHSPNFDIDANPGNFFISLSFAVGKTCVPLFVMLSGSLLLGKNEDNVLFFKKRIRKYIFPWLFWSLITSVIIISKSLGQNLNFYSMFKTTILSYWFLPMLTCLYIVTPPLRSYLKGSKSSDNMILLIFWFLFVSVLPFTINNPAFPLFIDNSLLTQTVRFVGYYLIGYLIVKYRYDTKVNYYMLGLMFVLGIIYTIYFTYSKSSGALYFGYHSPGIILISIAFFILIKKIFTKKISVSNKIIKPIKNLSDASYGIYLSHLIVKTFLIELFPFQLVFSIQFLSNYINGLFLFLICYLLIRLIKKTPLIGKMLV